MTIKAVNEDTPVNNTPEENKNAPFGIITQYIKDQSFENPSPVDSFLTQHEGQPNISVDISAKATKIREGLYEVLLDLKTKGTLDENKILFISELSYGALVSIDEKQIPQDTVAPLLMIHTPTLLFPFARAIMADMTREGGFPALMLHPVDFAALFQAQQNAQKEAS